MKRKLIVSPSCRIVSASANPVAPSDAAQRHLLDDWIDWAMCSVNDNDPSWELDTPEKFSEAVFDFLLDHSDTIEEDYEDDDVVGAILDKYYLLANFFVTFSDYIVENSSHGDFG